MPIWPPLCLELAVWGITAPSSLHWLDEPPVEAVNQAIPLLRSLEAVDAAGRVTARGRVMARLPLHPRLAHMVLAAKAFGLGKAACLLAAMADERDPLRLRDVDIRPRLALLGHGQGSPAVFRIREAARQIGRLVDAADEPSHRTPMSIPEEEQAGVLLALAYPDRLAQKRSRGSYRMANGRGGFLDDTDSLADEPVLAVGAVNGGSGNVRIWQGCAAFSGNGCGIVPDSVYQERRGRVGQPGTGCSGAEARELRGIHYRRNPVEKRWRVPCGPDGASGAFGYPGTRDVVFAVDGRAVSMAAARRAAAGRG